MRSTTRLATHRWLRSLTWALAIGVLAGCGQALVSDAPPDDAPGPADPTRMTMYLRDQSVLVIGLRITSGPTDAWRGVVSEAPTSQCILVPRDWTLSAWRVQDIIDRPDPLALNGPLLLSSEVIVDGDVTLAIDVDWSGNPIVVVDRVPEWAQGPPPRCP